METIYLKHNGCQANSKLWNSGLDSDKNVARDRKRKLRYVSNIYVIDDPSNPENNGKVFLFSYGQKIFDKIQGLIKPSNPAKKPSYPLDFWTGRDFELTVKTVMNYSNYDDSAFGDVTPLLGGDDAKLQEVWEKQHKLSDLIAPDKFKSYEELSARFNKVVNAQASSTVPTANSATVSAPAPSVTTTQKPSVTSLKNTTPSVPFDATNDEEDSDPMKHFKKLLEEE